ncbi:MAG: EVE domain-containing protein [Gammaproteobacteria bacterium]|nr:EVE domain-containing protein [Gammaproteobacteria bacterium]
MNYWLMKSEPETFGIEHLGAMPGQTEHWDGIRNYQARNFMRDAMKVGDLVFFYHSNCATPGIVGIMEIVREAYPDFTALDPESRYYDPKCTADNNRWCMVDVRLKQVFPHTIELAELKTEPALADMPVLRKGNRLSITPVSAGEWKHILSMI